jgi:hypothetical protein
MARDEAKIVRSRSDMAEPDKNRDLQDFHWQIRGQWVIVGM